MAGTIRGLGLGANRKRNLDAAIGHAATGNQGRLMNRRGAAPSPTTPEATITDQAAASAASDASRKRVSSEQARKRKARSIKRNSFGQRFNSGPTLKGGIV